MAKFINTVICEETNDNNVKDDYKANHDHFAHCSVLFLSAKILITV